MPSLRSLTPVVRLAVSCFVLAIGMRTWLVMGLIEPVHVAGSSMAPTLRGAHVTAECPRCGHLFCVGAEFSSETPKVACPLCAEPSVPLESLRRQPSDRLWVDRSSLQFRGPRRWELVVARNPHNGAELCIKRIVGLPEESVALRGGNVVIDGAVVVKSLDKRHALRQLVHREGASYPHWQPASQTGWQFKENKWQHQARQKNVSHWLTYQHPQAQPLTDDVTYNAGLMRQLNLVDEFMFSTKIRVQGAGTLSLRIDDGTATAQVDLHLPGGKVTVTESKHRGAPLQLSERGKQRLLSGEVLLEFSNFDHQLLLLIDGQIELRRPWPDTKAAGSNRPAAIGARGIDLQVGELTLYRDVYHSPHAANALPSQAHRWQLGSNEYFLLGDNAPISLDSRRWGPVPARLLVGKPLLSGR